VQAAANASHAGSDGGAGVRHSANHRDARADALLDVRGRNRGGDGDNEGIFAEGRLDLLENISHNLRLHGKQDNVGSLDGLTIVGRGVDAEFDGDSGGFFFMTDGGRDAFGGEEALFEKSPEEDAAEFASTKNSEMLIGEFRSHGVNIVTEEDRVVNWRGRRRRRRRAGIAYGTNKSQHYMEEGRGKRKTSRICRVERVTHKRMGVGSDRMRGMRKRRSRFAVLVLALLILAWVAGSALGTGRATEKGIRLKDVPVPMRDGVVLRADVWLPKEEGRFPTLIYRTPYGKGDAQKDWSTFAKAVKHGYAVMIQDVRGRYASDGEFTPYQNEGKDGYDTIEWAAQQTWSDGSVGTFGLSYPGAVQWLAAVESPPHLKAMVPAMTFSTPRNFFYSGGLFDGSWLEWIWLNIAPDTRKRKNLAGPKTDEEAEASWKKEHEQMEGFLPLAGLPDLKEVAPYYYQWLAHPPADAWWNWAELRNKYDRVHCAVLNFSGWYDEAYGPDGATTNFSGLLAARKGDKDPRTYTVIGPWTHGGQDTSKSGERDFGPTAAIDYDELILRWMDHFVRGVDNGLDREKPVRIFVMGKNQWRDEEAWPLQRAREKWLYLGPNEGTKGRGRLEEQPEKSLAAASTFISDPAHPVTDIYEKYGAHDYRALAGRDDVLVFDSEPMAKDLEVTGPVQGVMYVSANVPDFDLWVRLLDVAPDGMAFNLMSPGLDVLRASYREETVEPELLEPGRIYRLELNRMLTSNVFLKGHRIRVQVSGAFYPHFSRNLQTGESEIVSAESRAGRITIYHDGSHSSRIVLPVIGR